MFSFLFATSETLVIKGTSKPCHILMKTEDLTDSFTYVDETVKNNLTGSLKFDISSSSDSYLYTVEINLDKIAEGSFKLQIKITDHATQQLKHQKEFVYHPSQQNLKTLSHQISNYIFEKIQGSKGHFSSKIAFIRKYKTGPIKTKLFLCDYNGDNIKPLIESHEFMLGLTFSNCGNYLAYRSLHPRKGQSIWIYDLKHNTNINLSQALKNQLKKNLFGKNISALSLGTTADEILFARSFKGSTTLHSYNRTTGQLFSLTQPQKYIIQTCPVKTHDGKALLFSADTLGRESIYYVKNQQLIRLATNDVLDFSQPKICENVKGKNRIFFSGRGKGFSSIWFIDENLYTQDIDKHPTPIVTMKRPYFLEKPCPTQNGLYVYYLQQGLNYNGAMMIDIKGNQILNEANEPILAHLGTNITDIAAH